MQACLHLAFLDTKTACELHFVWFSDLGLTGLGDSARSAQGTLQVQSDLFFKGFEGPPTRSWGTHITWPDQVAGLARVLLATAMKSPNVAAPGRAPLLLALAVDLVSSSGLSSLCGSGLRPGSCLVSLQTLHLF